MDLAHYVIEAVLVEGRSYREVAAAHGVSKSWVGKVAARYREGGYEALAPRSRAPVHVPHRTPVDVEERIVALRRELVAAGRSVEDVMRLIGADWLVYQDLDDLIAACKHEDSQIEEFDTSCFSGQYVTGDITPQYLDRLQRERSDEAKQRGREGRGALKIVHGG